MPFIFDQPNLDRPEEGHLYFDPGDGRLITIFTNENRKAGQRRSSTEADAGAVHHLAFAVSKATFLQAEVRLFERGIAYDGPKDRGFMDSIYFEDPLGLLIELACYKFEPPFGCSHADVMIAAHRIRVARGDHHIAEVHLADAIEQLVQQRQSSLSADRTAQNPYSGQGGIDTALAAGSRWQRMSGGNGWSRLHHVRCWTCWSAFQPSAGTATLH